MTLHEARQQLLYNLMDIYDDAEATNITEMIMEKITGWPRIERISNKQTPFPDSQQQQLDQYAKRLRQHEPVQYVINEAWFAGMKFYVDKNVLIPRPETEELVEWLACEATTEKILDIGTGSGCIAIALKKKLPKAEVWGCDVSNEALTVARENAAVLDHVVDFLAIDFLNEEEWKQLPHIDIIVSNPPYVPLKDKEEISRHVKDYEPAAALFVTDNDPLIFYRKIAVFGRQKLNPGGSIYVEIHENLANEVKELFLSENYLDVQVKKDMQGKDRMIRIR